MANTTVENAHDLLKKGYALYEQKFNAKPQWAGCAPGRVNLIGEHIDYNDGYVLPMCLPTVTVLIGSKNNSNSIHIYSDNKKADSPQDVQFDVPSVKKLTPGNPKWANYVKGVVDIFNDTVAKVPGFNAIILSSVPLGSGLSSSAALEVATYTFLESLTDEKNLKLTDKALACQKVENDFVGVPCGIMDQYVSVMGEEGSALLIDCKTHEARHIPLGDDHHFVFLIINSNVSHELSSSEYSVRRAQCKTVLEKLHRVSFRDVSLKSLEDKKSQKILTDVEYRRGHHVVTEIDRTYRGANALREGEFEAFGKLMNEVMTR
uniref:Galactokinase n=1 Tax=Cacopsylla melanoneura TaxID=428564 RepID=A0A8D8PUA3_9HEMI